MPASLTAAAWGGDWRRRALLALPASLFAAGLGLGLVETCPALMMFGSSTCPVTDNSAPGLNALHRRFGDRVRFVMVAAIAGLARIGSTIVSTFTTPSSRVGTRASSFPSAQ